jgi:tRNA A37 threonylcarbamoyladenosine synthetase subunit TsaC/SUA5/YrdC
LSGEKSLLNPEEIIKYFKNKKQKPDLIITAGKQKIKKPSKLIDIRDINDIKILRK